MADENTTPEQVEQVDAPEVSPIESQARDQGWVPKEEWDGPEDQWRDAKTFVDRGEFFKKLEEKTRDIRELKKALTDLKEHNKKIAEVEYKRAVESLKTQKKNALENGDADAVVEIDERLGLVKDAQRTLAATKVASVEPDPEVTQVFVEWRTRNNWYTNNRAMRAVADDVGKEAAAKGMTPQQVLAQVEKEVRKEFPDKFRNPKRDTPGAVETSSPRGGSKASDIELSDFERQAMNRFVRQGIMTKEEYIKQLKATR